MLFVRRVQRERKLLCCPVRPHTSCLSHSTSFASALPRCEILFFSTLGISAYVWPSYSKHASQPGERASQLSSCESDDWEISSYRSQSAHEQQQFYPTPAVSTLALAHATIVLNIPQSCPGRQWARGQVLRSRRMCRPPGRTCYRSLRAACGIALRRETEGTIS